MNNEMFRSRFFYLYSFNVMSSETSMHVLLILYKCVCECSILSVIHVPRVLNPLSNVIQTIHTFKPCHIYLLMYQMDRETKVKRNKL